MAKYKEEFVKKVSVYFVEIVFKISLIFLASIEWIFMNFHDRSEDVRNNLKYFGDDAFIPLNTGLIFSIFWIRVC